jgi:hypothetical protein
MAVHVRQLQFIFKIRDRTQAAYQNIGILMGGKVCHQFTEPQHFHVIQVRRHLAGQGYALIQREQRLFARAGGDGQDDVIEHQRCACHQIQVAVSHGIESTGINGFTGHDSLL